MTYLVTGASRSLGLGYTRALLAHSPSTRVVAAVRNPSTADQLQALAAEEANKGRVYILKLDVEDRDGCFAAAKELERSGFLAGKGLDALVNNAGVSLENQLKPSEVTPEALLANLSPNLFGPINCTAAFLPLLRQGRSKQIITVSSVCGSVERFGGLTNRAAYSASKTAANMWTRKLAVELEPEGFTTVMFHPGYVKTDINSGGGDITTKEAVELALKNVFHRLTPADNGSFLSYDGEVMPW
ncbi:hypothetical protein JCM8097_005004 [Rhodosporidiobolus ruineniae]